MNWTDTRARWAAAAPLLAMAFSEAGYPCEYEPGPNAAENTENVIRFNGPRPPYDVAAKAGHLCGARDLIDIAWNHVESATETGAEAGTVGRW